MLGCGVGLTELWLFRQYLPRDKLQLLGEDSRESPLFPDLRDGAHHQLPFFAVELDSDMLAPQSLNQKWKSASARQTCREAFRYVSTHELMFTDKIILTLSSRKACAEMESKSDEGSPETSGLAAPLAEAEEEEEAE